MPGTLGRPAETALKRRARGLAGRPAARRRITAIPAVKGRKRRRARCAGIPEVDAQARTALAAVMGSPPPAAATAMAVAASALLNVTQSAEDRGWPGPGAPAATRQRRYPVAMAARAARVLVVITARMVACRRS